MNRIVSLVIIMMVGLWSCKSDKPLPITKTSSDAQEIGLDTTDEQVQPEDTIISIEVENDVVLQNTEKEKSNLVDATSWTELSENDGFILDIKYATTDNFTKKKIYDCGKCYLRPEAAANLKVIQQELKDRFGYSIKLFDCFRPKPYQQRLWDIVPNPDYVAPPHKGSMHSRGMAVDMTLVDSNGKELDMGTAFDFFGPEAHQGYNHNDQVKRHRWILRSTMEKHGFASIRTEWWHFSYKGKTWPLDEWVWECE
jgi:zinc D-Ala-D-Ala dipeptidase